MRVMNADGSEGEMCGNGIRCVALFLYNYALGELRSRISIWTRAGPIQTEVTTVLQKLKLSTIYEFEILYRVKVLSGDRVRVNMGPPRLALHELQSWCSLALLGDSDSAPDGDGASSADAFVNVPISGIPAYAHLGLSEWRITAVSMGNPHAVSLYFIFSKLYCHFYYHPAIVSASGCICFFSR
jgi:diaminopimelate epimerase